MNSKTLRAVTATGILSFAGIVVETAMNVAFPTLMRDFHVSTSAVQWLTTGYLLVLALVIPTSSFLKRSFKTKSLFVISNLFFILGTVAAMLAPSFAIILLGRLIQGIGTGIALPLMFNIIVEQVPISKTGTVMGFANLIIAIAPAVGPTMGGFIVKMFGWRVIFLVLLPLLVISLILGMTSITQKSAIEHLKFDFISWIILAIAFSSLVFATNQASISGWLDWRVIVLLLVSVLAILGFYKYSKKPHHPLIRTNVLLNWRFDLSTIALMISQFSILGTSFLLPNFAQLSLHQNAFVAGLLLLPGTTLGIFLSLLGGKMYDVLGARKPIMLGFSLYAIATLLFSIFMPKMTIWMIIIFFAIAIMGQAFSSGNTMTSGLHQVEDQFSTDANAVLNTVQQLAGALGTSIVATIVAEHQRAAHHIAFGTMTGVRTAFCLLFILQLVALLFTFLVTQKAAKKNKR
ncbi:DHA2 family efflux MFS transporter permease subunit [Ligilactobacillus aviarius]|uniref:MFS transporter n=1 Tax=Ligilactobacillus aviarius TaxID=1606 RepID=A0A510WRI9_9LACO|nr:DHA2 family efflux MFS transporter permease subunit [Ligilactobacillus aviarius]KRM39040.1 EmrB QacA subfamily drug resistance transporter [Ligilactobacillus aviarius subsp. aviarius DSM 20655]GEK41834.1 MFS transporter [Ligilactobacillus aviarius]